MDDVGEPRRAVVAAATASDIGRECESRESEEQWCSWRRCSPFSRQSRRLYRSSFHNQKFKPFVCFCGWVWGLRIKTMTALGSGLPDWPGSVYPPKSESNSIYVFQMWWKPFFLRIFHFYFLWINVIETFYFILFFFFLFSVLIFRGIY